MTKIEIDTYEPSEVMVIYRDKNNHTRNCYMEVAKVKNNSGNIEVLAFAPVRKKFLKDMYAVIEKDAVKFNFSIADGIIPLRLKMIGNEKQITWYHPPQKKFLYFTKKMGIEDGNYPLPGLIFSLEGDELSVYAVKETPNENTILYHAPFGNLYADGSVCWGNVEVNVKHTDFRKICNHVEKLFFKSKFTHTNSEKVTKSNLVTLFNSLTNKEYFPIDELLPSKTKINQLL
jgi:PRTRC genetic system protein B